MEGETLFADVIVPLGVPNKYTYRVPADMAEEMAIGKRVLVQFGKTRIYTAIVYRLHSKAPAEYTAKYVETVLDDLPVVTSLQLQFWDWLGFYYFANPGDVLNAALPSGLKLSSTSHVQVAPDFNLEETDHAYFTEREHQVMDALVANPGLSFDDIAGILKIKSAHHLVHQLLKKNAVVIYEDVKEKFHPKLQHFLRISQAFRDEKMLHETLDKLEKKAFRQAEALMHILSIERGSQALGKENWVPKSELTKKSEAAALAALVKKGILEEKQLEVGRLLFEKGAGKMKQLSADQELAYNQIRQGFEEHTTVLLHGVTGSGKTEIYIRLIDETLKTGRQVLFLIPEIALTTQLINRLRAAFGEQVGVYHSRFSENERVEIWNNVLAQGTDKTTAKQYRVILGARSSLFLPFTNLGLVVVDEEHDGSFKQYDPAPRYQARDAAIYLAGLHKAHVLLGSGTPSIESFYNCLQKKFHLVELRGQYVKGGGTHVEVCDLNYFEKTQQMRAASIAAPLFNAIQETLESKKQVILFQNRRGFAPYTECRQCGHIPHCVQCDVSLIYHKQRHSLLCHYCGYTVAPPKVCAACGSNQLRYKGMGTEKIEEDVQLLFPNARIARMDLDSTRSKYAHKQIIEEFEGGKIDILIGTQMVTKGLDFGDVRVVGILNADTFLNFPDFRSLEKAFQLIMQVRGRAGRGSEMGKVFLQTSQPNHPVVHYVMSGDFNRFFHDVLSERKQFNFPPYTRLIAINVISKNIDEVNHLSNELFNALKHFFSDILGPEFPLVAKIRNQFYKKMLVKVPRNSPAIPIREHIRHCLDELQSSNKNMNYRVQVDVDPL